MKIKLINTFVVFISVIILLVIIYFCVNNNQSSEQINLIYSDVIEHNLMMLENPVEYGDEYCSGYVSVKKDLQLHMSILDNIRLLSDTICVGAENDYDKVKAISYYVAENFYYNHVAADQSVTPATISLETVLDTQTATCAGYANMFSALCNMQGIYCVNLRGGTHIETLETSEYLLNAPINHEWNAVLIDNEWIFVDITWLSNNEYTENGYDKSDDFDDKYFDMSLEAMSYEHRIDIIDYRNFKTSINALSNDKEVSNGL